MFLVISVFGGLVYGQDDSGYREPSREILELVDVSRAPKVLIDHRSEYMLMLTQNTFKSIEELSRKELRLGGLRIDPKTRIGSRTTYYTGISVKHLTGASSGPQEVKGLPDHPKLSNFIWSPDQSKMAFTHTAEDGVEAWVLNLADRAAVRLTDSCVNACTGDVINWFADGQSLLVKMIPGGGTPLIDAAEVIPQGPVISVADGEKAQNRTYQDLLQNKIDEHNFEQLALSEIHKIELNGTRNLWLGAAMYRDIEFSPDGQYVTVTRIKRPFSYLVPYHRFPSDTTVYTRDADKISTVLEVPLIEDLPQGFMAVRTGRRSIGWRADRPASLIFAEALDGGDPENEVEFRDEVKQLEAPFTGEPVSLLKTVNRFSGIHWCSDDVAIASDHWWNTRNTKSYLFNPSDAAVEPVVLFDRNYQDKYSDPGNFVTERNEYGRRVLGLRSGGVYLIGEGFSEAGQFPFLDQLDLGEGTSERIYRSEYTEQLETLYRFDIDKNQLLVRMESPVDYPNYCFRNLAHNRLEQITSFENPFTSIQNVHKEVITYTREDGVELTGTLYLPVGYDRQKKEKVPMILWAYPREYKNKSSAGQNTSNPNKFTYPWYGSPIYWVTKGYAILDRAAFPIVGEGGDEPNDSFRQQLVANAQAAIDAVDKLGYIDRTRVAVGGHSYGAFMVANLLSHSDLFAAGIARSGAYNRTLTPFGFQSEERNYWEAPEVYNAMSPFMHADKMRAPLLLIHGEADNNSGTYPMQSSRYFNALKGLGATVRLVLLPKESHSYRAKESVLHMLWEQDQWLERYLK